MDNISEVFLFNKQKQVKEDNNSDENLNVG
jgi:hypothetical protein